MKKIQAVVLDNCRHLRISHKQRNTAELLRIPCFRVVPPGILRKESPQEIKKLCKEARPHRPSSEYLADSARKFTRCLQETKFHCARVSTGIRMPTCVTLRMPCAKRICGLGAIEKPALVAAGDKEASSCTD